MRLSLVVAALFLGLLGCEDVAEPVQRDDDDAATDPAGVDRGTLEVGGECMTLSFNDTWTLDVPSVEIEFVLTLNGEPVSEANTSADDFGQVLVWGDEGLPPAGWEQLAGPPLVSAYGSVLPDGDAVVRVPAGVPVALGYRCWADSGRGECDQWPANGPEYLKTGLVFEEPGQYIVDVQAVRPEFEVVLNGAPREWDDEALVRQDPVLLLRSAEGSPAHFVHLTEQGHQPAWTPRLLPGTYPVQTAVWGEQTEADPWPGGSLPALEVAPGMSTRVLDLDARLFELAWTVGGTPVRDAIDQQPLGAPSWWIGPAGGGAGSAVILPQPLQGWVPAGAHDVVLVRDGQEAGRPDIVPDTLLPWNTSMVLREGLEAGAGLHTVDIDVVPVEIALTIAGELPTTERIEAAYLEMTPLAGGGHLEVRVWESATMAPPVLRAAAAPGEYQLAFVAPRAQGLASPEDDRRLVQQDRFELGTYVLDGTPLAIDIPAVEVDLRVSFSGESSPPGALDLGLLDLVGESGNARVFLTPTGFEDSTWSYDGVRLVEGNYRVAARVGTAAFGYGGDVEVADGADLSIDLRPRRTTATVRMDGQPVAGSGLGILLRAEGYEPVARPLSLGGVPLEELELDLLPGTYQVGVQGSGQTPGWPDLSGWLGCLVVE